MSYVLGIDLGTSGLKGIVMDENGRVVAEKSSEYGVDIPKAGYSEQRPESWIAACENVLTGLSLEAPDFVRELRGISISGQMHSLVALGENNTPIYPAILWNDVRTTRQCREIMDRIGERLLAITKNIALEGFTLPKILWLQENEPEIWSKVRKIMLPKDYLGFWFTDNICSEYSDAAGTLLLDIEKREWSREIAESFNVSMDILPALVPSMHEIGIIKEDIKQRFNIINDVRVFAGGADNACAALGAGIINEETGLVSLGTSGVLSAFEPEIKDYQGKLHFFNHVIADVNYSMGVTLAAGSSLNWFRNTFGKGLSFEELLKDINQTEPGSGGLLFTPYISGERTPHFDGKIRGSFIGIDARHELRNFARSVLEGITFTLKDSQAIMERARGKKFSRLVSVGGGAKNPDWMQMQADIFDAEMIRLTVEQGPGAGACMIAAIGCGIFDSLEKAAETFVRYKEETFIPKSENVAKYQEIHDIWRQVYGSTKEISHQLGDIRR